jgi:hypothetical protein
MGQIKGYKGRVVIDFETAFKTAPTTPAGLVMPFNTESLAGSRAQNTAATITGRRDPAEPFDGNLDVSGSITVPVDAVAFPYWLKAMFGAPATTDNGDGSYTHVFTPAEVQPSLVYEKRFADTSSVLAYAKYQGVKVGSMSITIGGDGELVATIELMGATEEFSPTPYDAAPTALALARFMNFQAVISEGGTPLTGTLTTVDMKIGCGLDGDTYTIGDQGTRGDINEGTLELSGTVNGLFRDTSYALLQKAIDSTESSMKVAFTSGSNVLEFYHPEIKYGRKAPAIDGPKGVKIALPYQAYFGDATEGTSTQISVTNTTESYA